VFLALASGCGEGAPLPIFEIKVVGARSILEEHALSADGLVVQPLVREGRFVRPLRGPVTWAQMREGTVVLTATRAGVEVARQSLRPFVCSGHPQFARRVDAGWQAKETHDVFLEAPGRFVLDTDFYQPLSYACEWTQPGGGGGDGTSSQVSALPHCDAENRKGTAVTVDGRLDGVAFTTRATRCSAVLSDRYDGILNLAFSAETPSGHVAVSIGHCLTPPPHIFPRALELGKDSGCALGGSFQWLPLRGELRYLPASAGSWHIADANLSRGGRMRGDVAFVFTEGDNQVKVAGAFDLPLTRVPVEFDWKE
jgi:hypothetical protein